jgi:predicted acylesterase/phospholipase RssA
LFVQESIDKVYKQIRGSSASSQALSGQHQVLEAIKTRVESGSKPGARRDKHKIALAIEGGGMRGCVSAGMAAALEQLGLSDAFDVVYGSSAGSLIGAYFVAGGGMAETHRFFLEVLCESKTTVFDPSRLLDVLRHPNRPDLKPAMCLDAISNIMCFDTGDAYLDWNKFEKRNRVQPLKIIASDVSAGRAVALSSLEGSFHDQSSLMKCLKASCFLPGIAGRQPVRLTQTTLGREEENEENVESMLLVDALIYEPIPYRSALEDGCTHVLVLRTWPDDHALPQSFMRIFEK